MKLLLIMTIFSCISFANTWEECSSAVPNYGGGHLHTEIPEACFSLIQSMGAERKIATSEDGMKEVLAYGNLVYIADYEISDGNQVLKSASPLAGKNPLIQHVLDLELSAHEERFYVLDDDGSTNSVYSYSTDHGGNLAPLRKLISDDIQGASGIEIDYADKKLFVFSKHGWVKAFNIHADPDGRRPENGTKSLFDIEAQLTSPIDLAVSEHELFVLESDRVLVFSKEAYNEGNSDSVTPNQIIDAAGGFENVSEIKFDPKENALSVSNQEGVDIVFKKDLSGSYIFQP